MIHYYIECVNVLNKKKKIECHPQWFFELNIIDLVK